MKLLLLPVMLMWTISGYSATVSGLFPTSDEEDCQMCHRYKRLGRVTRSGEVKSYYVQQDKFFLSAHREISCRQCHTEIDEIPHKKTEAKVDCSAECHVTNKQTGERYSHLSIYQKHTQSVHGDDEFKDSRASYKPDCTGCHLNNIFNPHIEKVRDDQIESCVDCHLSIDAADEKWFAYNRDLPVNFSRREPEAINQLCGSCHGDPLYMNESDITERSRNAYESYRDSLHGKLMQLNRPQTTGFLSVLGSGNLPPHCLDCHADAEDPVLGVHELYHSENPLSTVHEANVSDTCRKCHEDANRAFAMVTEVHNFPGDYSLIERIVYEFFFWFVAIVFFVLTLRVALEHNRKIVDRWRDRVNKRGEGVQ
jgi:hypothetical protein